jgi:MYXO-CTERM domain-containing protein
MLRQKTGNAWLWLSALLLLWSGTAHAGPMEILNAVSISPTNANNMVLYYTYGQQGIFVSTDGGKTLKWLCSTGADVSLSNRNFVAFASGDGSLYMGSGTGLLRGDANGCNFAAVPELSGKWIRAISGDPIKAERTYVATSNGMGADNGIFMRDGSGEFVQFGSQVTKYIASLHVVKMGDARRFYETAVFTNLDTNMVNYFVRVSDDDAMTWTEEAFDTTQFAVMDKVDPSFEIAAIDPKNPDNVVAWMPRHMKALDTLIFSKQKGKAGTWEKIADVTERGGVTFTPDGALYFGDDDFATKGLFKVTALGEKPTQVQNEIRVTCLQWDEANKRLLGCSNNYHFGELDTETGKLTPLLDLRCAEHAVSCPDEPEIQELCAPPTVEFCKIDHWVAAPLCKVYDRGADCATYATAQGYTCEAGQAISTDGGVAAANAAVCMQPAAAGAAAGSGATAGAVAAAGSGGEKATAGSGGSAAGGSKDAGVDEAAGSGGGSKSSGCSCSSVGGRESKPGLLALGLLWMGLAIRKRRAS